MHENMYVCEQGEHHFLLDFVLSSCVHRLHVHAQSLHVHLCYSCPMVLSLSMECSYVHSCLMKGFIKHTHVCLCGVHMHLFLIQDLMSLLEVCM